MSRRRPDPRRGTPPPPRRSAIGFRPLPAGGYELTHPPCAELVMPDYEEAMILLDEGDDEEATEALRYALGACRDSLWLHVALGRIALTRRNDPELARGHFGYAFELVEAGLPRDFDGYLPRSHPANMPLYETIDGLAACYEALGQHRDARALRDRAALWSTPPAKK